MAVQYPLLVVLAVQLVLVVLPRLPGVLALQQALVVPLQLPAVPVVMMR